MPDAQKPSDLPSHPFPPEKKQQLVTACKHLIDAKIDEAHSALELNQQAADQETKSSVGDKYETGRAMAHLDRERIGAQLVAAEKSKSVFEKLDFGEVYETCRPGCVIGTSMGAFVFAAAVGEITFEGDTFQTLSAASPLGKALLGKSAGAQLAFRGKSVVVQWVV